MKNLFIALIIICFAVLTIYSLKSKKFFRCILSSSFQGIAAMFAVNVLGMVTGLHIAVNWWTLGFSMVFGTPGVICLTMAQFIFSK